MSWCSLDKKLYSTLALHQGVFAWECWGGRGVTLWWSSVTSRERDDKTRLVSECERTYRPMHWPWRAIGHFPSHGISKPPSPPSPLQLPPISITNFFSDFDCSIFLSQTQSEIQETSDHGRISPILNISASAKNRQLQKVMLFRLFGFGSHALQNKIDARCFFLWTHLNMFFFTLP